MAKARNQKSKPSRQAKQINTRKRGGKQNGGSELKAQLEVLGLKIIHVTADGNCFFRALADQLEGDEDEHQKYRSMVVRFLKENREMFEPFVEDEVPFDKYCESMEEDGTWAGHMELQAASLVTRTNICIHRHMSPRWYIQNFDIHEARMIHLSYHDGEHYNSVRSKEDTCSGPARPIIIKGDAVVSTKSDQPKASARTRGEGEINAFNEDTIKLVEAGSGCEDARKVEQALLEVGGDVDAAVEVLVAEQGSSDQIIAEDGSSSLEKTSYDESHQNENSDQHTFEDGIRKPDLSVNDVEKCYQKKPQPDEKKISRNKACPCGSKKKYKSCCSTVSGRSSGRFPVNQMVDYGKIRKDRKQGRKGGVNVRSEGGPPDMGALCI